MAILEATGSRPQVEFVNSSARYPAFVGGFGSGKTHALILRSMALMINQPADIAFYMPTYGLIKDVLYPRFRELLSNAGISHRINAQDHTLYALGRRVIFRSLDNPDKIIGYEVGHSLVDELDTMPTEKARRAWQMIIARNRQKGAGMNTAAVGTTPEGFRFVYERWQRKPGDDYELIRAPTYSNPHLPEGYVQTLRDSYDERLLEAYLEGQFVNMRSGTVYGSYDRAAHRSDERASDVEPLYVGMDFNVQKQAAVIYVIRKDEHGDVWHAVDELRDMLDTPECIRVMRLRYPGNRIICYPDATGRATSSRNASESDISLLKEAGWAIRAKKTNPQVRDRVNAMNRAFEKGRLMVNDEACPRFAECLEQQAWRNGEPDKTSDFDHQNDAGGYPIAYEMPIRRPVLDVNVSFAM